MLELFTVTQTGNYRIFQYLSCDFDNIISVFVLLAGQSREEAFRIGKEIASKVSDSNPKPVTLKLEKVYQPCVLMSKKRYSGYRYDASDATPEFEAKGIETVRRDGCRIVSKMLEKSLRY